MNRSFEVIVEKESLIFSAAHFITIGDEICESIHGHNYRVACKVTGDLDRHSTVVDFIWLRDELKNISSKLDHRVLLPTEHPRIMVAQEDGQITARYDDRSWSFPAEDVALLPVDNTTAERLAEFIGAELIKAFQHSSYDLPQTLSVGVDENEGQWAWCHLSDLSSPS